MPKINRDLAIVSFITCTECNKMFIVINNQFKAIIITQKRADKQ